MDRLIYIHPKDVWPTEESEKMNNAMAHYKKIAAICREDNVILVAKDDIENTYNGNPNIKKGDELHVEFGCESILYARGFDAEKTWRVSVPDTHFHLLEFKHL